MIIRVFLYLILYIIRVTILYTQMSPQISCTISSYTQLLHVSAMYPGHLQGATSMVDVYSVYGNLSYITGRIYIYIYIVKVKQSHYRPKQTLRVLGGWSSQIWELQPPRTLRACLGSRHMKVLRLSALRTGRLLPPRKYPWHSFLLEAESTPWP